MATLKLEFLRTAWSSGARRGEADSAKAREAIHAAYKKSGGPTADLKRVYGEYLEYKRARAATAKN